MKWSPDGQRLYIIRGGRIFQLSTDIAEPLLGTRISAAASETDSGSFTRLRGDLPTGFDSFASFHTHGTRSDPDTWNARGQWDAKRQRTYFYGDRRENVFHSYHADTNRWSHNALDESIPGAPHQYGKVGLDVERGHFYRSTDGKLFRYLIADDRWEVASESQPSGGTSPMEFHEGLNFLLALADEHLHQFTTNGWEPFIGVPHNGAHANMIYNRARGEMIIVGGSNTEHRVSLLTDDGKLHRMGDLPFRWSAQHNSLSYDPDSGNFLVLHRKEYKLWEYDPSQDRWELAQDWQASNQDDWTFGSFYGHVLIPIDELDVVLWMHRSEPMVYRHASVFSDADSSNPIAETTRSVPEDEARGPATTAPSPRPAPTPGDEAPDSGAAPSPDHASIPEPPPELAETELGKLAAELPPGGFQTLSTNPPSGVTRLRDLFTTTTPAGRRVPIDAWTDSAHWDPKRKRTLFQGPHGASEFLSYDVDANTWQKLGWEGNAPPADHEQDDRTYSRTALDWEGGHYYRLVDDTLYRFDLDTARWSSVAPTPAGGHTLIEWHKALGKLINVRDHVAHAFDGKEWHELGEVGPHGEYSTARYNTQREELLILGGDGSERAVSLLDKDGEIRQGADAPFDHKLSLDNLTYDPSSGRYLVLRWDEREMWEYDADTDNWQRAREWSGDDWPFHEFGTVVPIPIGELGVVFWQYEHGPRVYRHQPVSERLLAEDGEASPQRGQSDTPRPRSDSERAGTTAPVPDPSADHHQPHEGLAAIGETMQPGEWRYVETENTPSFRVQFCPLDEDDSGSTHALGWTGSYAYDPETQSYWAIGMRGRSEKRLFMLDRDLKWTEARIPLDECATDRRPFNRLSLVDGYLYWASSNSAGGGRGDRGRLLRAPIQAFLDGDMDVAWETYSEGLGISNMNAAGDFAVEWFPELKGWVFAGRRSGTSDPRPFSQEGHTPEGRDLGKHWYARVMFLRPPKASWMQFDRVYSGQYQSQLIYNPVKREMLLAPGGEFGSQPEGSAVRREWSIIHPEGGSQELVRPQDDGPTPWVEKLDRPVGDGFELPNFRIRYGTVGYAPHTGDYIWWNRDREVIWTSPDGKHWRVYEDFSDFDPARFPEGVDSFDGGGGLFGATGYVQMNAVPGTDLVVFFDPDKGVILHRMEEP